MARPSIWPSTRNVQTTGRRVWRFSRWDVDFWRIWWMIWWFGWFMDDLVRVYGWFGDLWTNLLEDLMDDLVVNDGDLWWVMVISGMIYGGLMDEFILKSWEKKVWYDLVYILLRKVQNVVADSEFFLAAGLCKMQTKFVGRAVRSVAAAFFLWRRPCETKTESKQN